MFCDAVRVTIMISYQVRQDKKMNRAFFTQTFHMLNCRNVRHLVMILMVQMLMQLLLMVGMMLLDTLSWLLIKVYYVCVMVKHLVCVLWPSLYFLVFLYVCVLIWRHRAVAVCNCVSRVMFVMHCLVQNMLINVCSVKIIIVILFHKNTGRESGVTDEQDQPSLLDPWARC